MKEIVWKLERTLLIAVRRPRQYIIVVSAVGAGIFSSLKLSEPIREYLARLPFLTDSDWLRFILFIPLFAIVLKLASVVLGKAIRREPFEILASYVDASGIAPSLNEHLERRIAQDPSLRAVGALDYRARPVEHRELPTLCQINREIFSFTSYLTPLDIIKKRNYGVHKANHLSYYLVEAKIEDEYVAVGMSGILPLNQIGAGLYLRNNGLKDEEIRGTHIAAPGEWPEAVVLFAMGILRSFRYRLKDRGRTLPYVFVDHLADIVADIRQANPTRTEVVLYAQTENIKGGVGRALQRLGFIDSHIICGDGYPLWELLISLPVTSSGESARVSTLALLERLAEPVIPEQGRRTETP